MTSAAPGRRRAHERGARLPRDRSRQPPAEREMVAGRDEGEPSRREPEAAQAPVEPPRVIVPRWVQLVLLPISLLALWALARAAGKVLLIFVVAGLIALILNPLGGLHATARATAARACGPDRIPRILPDLGRCGLPACQPDLKSGSHVHEQSPAYRQRSQQSDRELSGRTEQTWHPRQTRKPGQDGATDPAGSGLQKRLRTSDFRRRSTNRSGQSAGGSGARVRALGLHARLRPVDRRTGARGDAAPAMALPPTIIRVWPSTPSRAMSEDSSCSASSWAPRRASRCTCSACSAFSPTGKSTRLPLASSTA